MNYFRTLPMQATAIFFYVDSNMSTWSGTQLAKFLTADMLLQSQGYTKTPSL